MYGLTDKEFYEMTQIFEKCDNLEKVILYGSRAKGNFKRFSDVDITLVGESLTVSNLFQIEDLLYESDLPYMFDVSIFSKITNIDLINHIRRRGIEIWKKLK